MKVDRWNGGTMRRYHFAGGAIGVVYRDSSGRRIVKAIPAWSRHVSAEVAPAVMAAEIMRNRRALTRA